MLRLAFFVVSATFLTSSMAAPGSFDPRFGTNGVLNLSIATNGAIPATATSFISALTVAPDGAVHIGGALSSGLGVRSAVAFNTRVTADGRLDTAFGVNGLVRRAGYATNGATTDFISVLPSGRVIASDAFSHNCGFTCPAPPPPSGRRTSAYLSTGLSDAGFTEDVDFDAQFESGNPAATTFADGTLVMLSRYVSGALGEIPRARALLANGSRDTAFEVNAVSALGCGNEGGNLISISVRADTQDRLVVAYGLMKDFSGGRYSICILRLTRAGLRDATFGAGGLVNFSSDALSTYVPDGLSLTADGAVRVGLRYYKSDFGTVIARAGQIRLTNAGVPDTSLPGGATPIFAVPFPTASLVSRVVPMADGRTVLSGTQPASNSTGLTGPVIVRMTAAGTTDAGYGQNGSGIAALSGAGRVIHPEHIRVLEADGAVLIAGYIRDTQSTPTVDGLGVAKLEGGTVASAPPPSGTSSGGGGDGGGGCGITRQPGAPDPLLPLLVLMAAAALVSGARGAVESHALSKGTCGNYPPWGKKCA